MSVKYREILVVESSDIIYEGLAVVLAQSGKHFVVSRGIEISEIQQLHQLKGFSMVILNPSLILNNLKLFATLKRERNDIKWVGLIYTFIDQKIISLFDKTISISDSNTSIVSTLLSTFSNDNIDIESDNLSDREIEILKLLTEGLSNKQIADNLNISTHTAITHRKNISQKTGIKSLSGLTIYAMVKNIIRIEHLK